MNKKKLLLTSKPEKLIEIITYLPSQEDAGKIAFWKGICIDCKETAFNAICDALSILSNNTKTEELCNELIQKANTLYHREERKN